MTKALLFLTLVCTATLGFGQSITVKGVVIDEPSGRRLDAVRLRVSEGDLVLSNSQRTGRNGTFSLTLPAAGTYDIDLLRAGYAPSRTTLELDGSSTTVQVNLPLTRLPGYEFDFTIRAIGATGLGDTIGGARVEMYDVTRGVQLLDTMVLGANHEVALVIGRRYAFLMRKPGFFAKRFDVLVDVEGCVLCFEGIGTYFEPELMESISGSDSSVGAVIGDIGMRPITIGEEVVVSDIYYDFDKSTIRADARPAVDRLAAALKATPVEVTLGSHTDSRGTAEYNQSLSQRRAEAVVAYLRKRGIAANRVKAVGYGESQLTNSCTDDSDCSEAEHQANRRTTFAVTKLMQRSTFETRMLKQLIEEEQATRKRAVEVLEVTRDEDG